MRLAWKNILHDRVRFATTVLGIAFAIFLMVFQGSLLAGFLGAASKLVDAADSDLRRASEFPRRNKSPKQRLYVWEQQATTRSSRYPGILSELLVLNFNLHTEHHLFPALPWFRLKQARKPIKPVLTPGYNEVHGIGWNYDMRTGDLDHCRAELHPSHRKRIA